MYTKTTRSLLHANTQSISNKETINHLGESFENGKSRLKQISQNLNLKTVLHQFHKEYEHLLIIKYDIPTTKLRVVFDASSKNNLRDPNQRHTTADNPATLIFHIVPLQNK